MLVDHLLMLTTFSGTVGGQLRQVSLYTYIYIYIYITHTHTKSSPSIHGQAKRKALTDSNVNTDINIQYPSVVSWIKQVSERRRETNA